MTWTGPSSVVEEPEPQGGVGVLAVVVTAGNTPFLARTLEGVASQVRRPDVVLVVDVASRANGLGDGTPIEEVVESCGLDASTAVRIVRAGEVSTFGAAVSAGLSAYADLVTAGSRRRSRQARSADDAAGPERQLLTGAGQAAGPSGAMSPITRQEQALVPAGQPGSSGRQVWLWLLHDDSAPQEGCLHALLTAASNAPSVGVVGPKQVAWDRPDQLLEVGLSTTASARRDNSIVAGEVDQGQYDDRSDVLAVGTAGALVDRGAWDEVEGVAPWLGPFGDGLELCRAVRLCGYRVIVEPQAVLCHRRASYLGMRPARRGRRSQQADRGRRRRGTRSSGDAVPVTELPEPDPDRSFRERRTAQLTLWASFSTRPLPLLLTWFVVLGALRAVWRLVAKAPGLARDELSAALAVAGRGARVRAGRQRLSRHTQVPRSALSRLYVEPARIRAVRRDRARQERERLARDKAPSELELHELAALARSRRRTLALTLLVVAGIAVVGLSHVLVSRSLAGGAMVSLGAGWRETWDAAWSAWILSADGYQGGPSPLLGVLALPMAVGSVVGLDGDAGLHVLFLVALPLAALGAWFAAGAVTRRTALRGAAALAWALTPNLLLAVGQGRLTAVLVHLALPWMLLALARAVGADRRDVVLSGLVGAHLLTDSERAELDRFAQDRVEDLAHLGEDEEDDEREKGAKGPRTGRDGDERDQDAQDAREEEHAGARAVSGARSQGDDGGAGLGGARGSDGPGGDSLGSDGKEEDGGDEDDGDEAGDEARRSDTLTREGASAPLGRSVQVEGGSGSDAALVERYGPGSAAAAAAAGLLACLVVAAAPATAPLLVLLILLLVVLTRGGARLLLTLLPLVLTAAPAWWRAWLLASELGWAEGLRLLVTEAGRPVVGAPPSGVDLLLGSPTDLDLLAPSGALALVAKLLLAVVPAAALVGGALSGHLGARARTGLLMAAGGLGLATLSTRTVIAVGTGLGSGSSLLVTGWAGAGLSFALAGFLLAGLAAGDAVTTGLARRWPRWQPLLAGLLCLVVVAGPVLAGALWAWQARGGSAGPAQAAGSAQVMSLRTGGRQVPLVAAQIQSSASQGRVLYLAAGTDGLHATVWRYAGTQLVDVLPEVLSADLRSRTPGAVGQGLPVAAGGTPSGPPEQVPMVVRDDADAALVTLAARAVAGQDEDVAALLAEHGVAVVLLAEASGDELTAEARSGLASTPGLDQMAQTESGTAWRVASEYTQQASRLTVVGADGEVTMLPSSGTSTTVQVDVPRGEGERTLVLAERSNPSWSAALNGTALETTTVSTDGGTWKQAFLLPAEGGSLELRYERGTVATVLTYAIWAAWVLTAVAALPLRRGRETL